MLHTFELEEPEKYRFEHIIGMGLGFSSMLRLFSQGSIGILHEQLVKKTAEDIFNAKSREYLARAISFRIVRLGHQKHISCREEEKRTSHQEK